MSDENQIRATIAYCKAKIAEHEDEIRSFQKTMELAEFELWSVLQQQSKERALREREGREKPL